MIPFLTGRVPLAAEIAAKGSSVFLAYRDVPNSICQSDYILVAVQRTAIIRAGDRDGISSAGSVVGHCELQRHNITIQNFLRQIS